MCMLLLLNCLNNNDNDNKNKKKDNIQKKNLVIVI